MYDSKLTNLGGVSGVSPECVCGNSCMIGCAYGCTGPCEGSCGGICSSSCGCACAEPGVTRTNC